MKGPGSHPARIVESLQRIAAATDTASRRRAAIELRRHVRAVNQRLEKTSSALWSRLRELESTGENQPTAGEQEQSRAERERCQADLSAIGRLEEALEDVTAFIDGPEGVLLTKQHAVLLLGEWGTGKTHFLCDFALHQIQDGTPALVVLASELRVDLDPLDALADFTGLAASGDDLVRQLNEAGRKGGRRSLILVDALNESDRDAWRRSLPKLERAVGRTGNVGLIVTCRTPFDASVVPDATRARMVVLSHPGFVDQQFDAQLEFFRYYNLPALHVPLLTEEFSRPLFLRLLCEGIKDLGRRSQKNHLRDLASGQKSMTYVLERFVKEVGASVEDSHGLSRLACWQIMKGEPRRGRLGLAGVLATGGREWLSRAEGVAEVQALTGKSEQESEAVLDSMRTAGLLVEHARYEDGATTVVLVLPYQRFSDHLVARHLLDSELDTSSVAAVKRSFYRNRRLGAVFLDDHWGHGFAEPGIASALMIEFPERMRRLAETENAPRELVAYLPSKRRLLYAVADVFIEGLYWRPATSFGPDTVWMVELLLGRPDLELRQRTLEVLVGLSCRNSHPLGGRWLLARLGGLSMVERDLLWSEFIRTSGEDSNVHRLLTWAEREEHGKVESAFAIEAMRVIALLLTTTDRQLRDRATRALVLIGEAGPDRLFDLVPELLAIHDPYISERVLAACYGVCMRMWAVEPGRSALRASLPALGRVLLENVLAPHAPFSTWHVLSRGYAIGTLQILRKLAPHLLTAADRDLLDLSPGQASSPFRAASRIRQSEVADAEHAIHMDFGNYTIGRLVDGRDNYDFSHREYAGVRKQIADRMRRLGYSTETFGDVDRTIARYQEYRRDGGKVDRYGKKYGWVAYFEMFGLRRAHRSFGLDYPDEVRSSDCDIDPSFPEQTPQWSPELGEVFASSPTDPRAWITNGADPDLRDILRIPRVDEIAGDWILLDTDVHHGAGDGREIRGWVTSVFAPPNAVERIRREVERGRSLGDGGFPRLGADYYAFHGEVPWSPLYGSDVRTTRGRPKRLSDRAFDYYDGRAWRPGIRVEAACRRWAWEDHHSTLNQSGGIVFPAPALAEDLGLRVVGGSSDMVDAAGDVATIFRRQAGPGFGSYFLFMRADLLHDYLARRGLQLLQAIVLERSISHRVLEDFDDRDHMRELLQRREHISQVVLGL